MKSRGKLTDMDLEINIDNKDDVKMLDTTAILENYKDRGCPVDDLITAINEQVRMELKNWNIQNIEIFNNLPKLPNLLKFLFAVYGHISL